MLKDINMICVVITGPSVKEAQEQIEQASKVANLVEIRLDCFPHIGNEELAHLRSICKISALCTLRSQSQGGHYNGNENSRYADLNRIAALSPEYMDIESHVSNDIFKHLRDKYPQIKMVVSHHDFTKTPPDLDSLYKHLKEKPAALYKIAVTAQSSNDMLRLLAFLQKTDKKCIGISMGDAGQPSRILGPIFGSPIAYASLNEKEATAPGQLTFDTLIDRYHFRSLSPSTKVYGLIGDPVDKSISDITHNSVMHECGLDAVYIKMPVKKEELKEFFPLAKQLGFGGLSVTMPLKESVLPFLDHIDNKAKHIGAVNTLLFEKDHIVGYNTDGIGALNAIEEQMPVKGKKIIILGSGGAAKAIAYEAQERGANICILNRTEEKAVKLANQLNCRGGSLKTFPQVFQEGYDLLINCTPEPLPIDPSYLISQAYVMDIKTTPKDTALLQAAREKGCRVIYGYKMFVHQAAAQFALWFKDKVDQKTLLDKLDQSARSITL